ILFGLHVSTSTSPYSLTDLSFPYRFFFFFFFTDPATPDIYTLSLHDALPIYLESIFDRLRRGYHLGPDDEPEFSCLCELFDEYAAYFAAVVITLVRHEREFFYFNADDQETVPDTLPRIAVFSYIIDDHAANHGRPIEIGR